MLNTQHFTVIAGNVDTWDNEIRERVANGEDLPSVQVSQYGRGRRSAELVKTFRGWSVRSGTGLDDRRILFGGRNIRPLTFAEAVAWGIEWANQDPTNREFFVRNSDLEAAREAGEDLSIILGKEA